MGTTEVLTHLCNHSVDYGSHETVCMYQRNRFPLRPIKTQIVTLALGKMCPIDGTFQCSILHIRARFMICTQPNLTVINIEYYVSKMSDLGSIKGS